MNPTATTEFRPKRYPGILAFLPTLILAGVLAIAGLFQATKLDAGNKAAPAASEITVPKPQLADPTMAIYLVDSQEQADFVQASRVSLPDSAASVLVVLAGTPEDEERAYLILNEVSDAWDREGHGVYIIDLRTPR